MIARYEFAGLPGGGRIERYRITNSSGEFIELLDYGAALQSICVRDRDGRIEDILLGTDDGGQILDYPFLGATVGRCANRVAEGRFQIDGHTFQPETDRQGRCIHSGSANYAHRRFNAECQGEDTVVFTLEDDGRGGFECAAHVKVSYSFGDDGCIRMRYEMRAEGDTIFNPTNHSYFNLGAGDVREQTLMVNAERKAACGEDKIPRGGSELVAGTAADFRRRRVIRENMGSLRGYDEYYLLREDRREAAELVCGANGRRMRLYTDLPCLVLCMFPVRKPIAGKGGAAYCGYPFVCLEPGYVPNAVNCPEYASPVFRKGEVFRAEVRYCFDAVMTL